ncbi:U2 snRNP complex subunit [Malassezia yamatoensis]|uniref:U2 small nuclear ribonucleoprotein A' n=1 Tax=Malassezia yamatoensis TaxID=253288 RepID=A0AAJ5YP64_9BASI|nr:U2 snRNP complex subunit [Malassezia yamatoensis]
MKLSGELLAQCDSTLNPLKQRELDLRGLKIVVIENLGITRDQNEALDFTDNEIKYLGNFPRLLRLQHLMLSNNSITRIDPLIGKAIPYLHTLVLTNNAISDTTQLVPLRRLRRLEYLSLLGNPVALSKHYREYTIWRIPSVRVLDFKRVTDKERDYARSLMELADGRPSELAVQLSGGGASVSRTSATHALQFQPGAPLSGGPGRQLTAKDRTAIQQAIDQSESLEEIRRLEDQLKMGYLPNGAS